MKHHRLFRSWPQVAAASRTPASPAAPPSRFGLLLREARWARTLGLPRRPRAEARMAYCRCLRCAFGLPGDLPQTIHCRKLGCGCTRLRPWLTATHCPLGLWPQGEGRGS